MIGGELTPELVMEMNRVESSRADYKRLVPQSRELNSLIKGALEKKGVYQGWIKESRMIPIEDCTRGSHRATDVLIYNRDDFRELTFGLYKKLDVKKFMGGVTAHTDSHQLEVRPTFYPSYSGKVKQRIDVLLRGFWGWYSERTIEEEQRFLQYKGDFLGREPIIGKEPIAEVWKYRPSVSNTSEGVPYLAFYTKEGCGPREKREMVGQKNSTARLGWVYFPVEKQHTAELEKLIQDSTECLF